MMGNDMMKMMMMSQMMKGGDESEGGSNMDMSMLAALFGGGDEPVVESVWEDAVTFGTARDRNGDETIGVLETRMTPAHADDPTPRVKIKTNGIILARPEDLKKISAKFAAMHDDELLWEVWQEITKEDVLESAQKAAQEKRSTAALTKLM